VFALDEAGMKDSITRHTNERLATADGGSRRQYAASREVEGPKSGEVTGFFNECDLLAAVWPWA
jgi:hypothetical protein